jgi:hypothetical protein
MPVQENVRFDPQKTVIGLSKTFRISPKHVIFSNRKEPPPYAKTVTLYILTLRLLIHLPSKYPTRVWFLGGGVAETREAPLV